MNTYGEWSNVLERYRDALGDVALKDLHIHISGIEYTKKGEKKHLPLGEADLDLDAILRALKDHNCGGRILCESPILEEDALNIKEAWETLTGSHA